MTFSYRHRKLIVLLLLFLLSVIASFLILRSHFTPKKKTSTKKIVLTPKKKEETTTDNDTYYLVDIKGEVNNPGTYSVKKGSRVIDVIHLAGELKSDADTSVLNLSKKVTDEMVIIVYSYDEVKNFTKVKEVEKQEQEKCASNNGLKNDACISTILEDNSTSNTKVSINKATLEELMTLTGIGEAKAKEIINYREEKGEFTDINQLKEVKGIGDTLFESIKDNITL